MLCCTRPCWPGSSISVNMLSSNSQTSFIFSVTIFFVLHFFIFIITRSQAVELCLSAAQCERMLETFLNKYQQDDTSLRVSHLSSNTGLRLRRGSSSFSILVSSHISQLGVTGRQAGTSFHFPLNIIYDPLLTCLSDVLLQRRSISVSMSIVLTF